MRKVMDSLIVDFSNTKANKHLIPRRRQLFQKGVESVKVKFTDGTEQDFSMDGCSSAFYRERYTYQENLDRQVTHVLLIHELYWVVKNPV